MSIAVSDPDRLQKVATAIADALANPAPDGRVRLPVVQPADAAGLVAITHIQLDLAIEHRSAEAAQRGLPIACARGCNACCISPLVVTEGEAVAVAEWLRDPANAAVRARFAAAYPAWRAALGELVDQAGTARSDEENLAWCIAAKQRHAMCAFNHDGACSIYPVRPALCRKTHALYNNAHCGDDSAAGVSYFEHADTEDAYASAEPLRQALHHALRPGKPLEMLCAAVHRLLAPEVGRNDPCPCGSGKKYKHCHGKLT